MFSVLVTSSNVKPFAVIMSTLLPPPTESLPPTKSAQSMGVSLLAVTFSVHAKPVPDFVTWRIVPLIVPLPDDSLSMAENGSPSILVAAKTTRVCPLAVIGEI